ncbi:MAG: HAD family phosphatase [Bacteroidetes bacterium]|nr:HAD family phosphatase [Bacteroidota bacterium]
MEDFKNLLFDFGGVLLNIDYNRTVESFKKLGYNNFEELFSQYKINGLFENFEKGHISEELLFETLKSLKTPPPSTAQIISAWNDMLLSYRIESLEFLELLKQKYNLYLLSNTNITHKREFDKMLLQQTNYTSLSSFFKKAYYSHLIGYRKPYENVFEFVMNDAGIKAEGTLFIDDSINNIEAAKRMGFKTYYLQPEERIEEQLAYLISS